MKKGEKSDSLVLASTALFLCLIVNSSIALAASNVNALTFQGNYEDAIRAYDKAIENDSQGSDAWYYKGAVLAFQRNFEGAIKAFNKAIEIDPQFASAWYNKGLCLVNLGYYEDFEEAIKAFDKAIEIVPQNEDAWINKGLCLVYLGNYEEAIKAFDKAIAINSQEFDAWYYKGLCLMNLGYYEDYKEAIKAFDKAIEISPQNLDAWCNKGLCLGYLGNYEEAVKAFDKAIEINSQDSNAWYNKGYSLECLDNYEEAVKAFDKAIEINSQYSNAWYNKGYSLECLGNYEEAVKAFDKAIEINSQDSDAWYNRGTCLAHLGNYKEAAESLDKAIEIDPQNSQALRLKESISLNSNGLMTSLKSLFFNNNIFVKEDDLVEYSQTYLKTYEDIIYESNLTSDDLGLFSFYQSYPYSVNATISNIYGASITFIPHSIDEIKVTRITYPIEKLIPIINNEELNSPSIRGISIVGSSSDFSMVQNFYGGNVSSISDMENYSFRDGFVYANNSSNNSLYKLTDAPIILGERAHFNGLTYIDSNKVFRKGELIINGTLILNDSKVIVKSDLKKDWTKKRAEEDAIDFIYKEQIDGIFNYSKLTGIGFHEIETLVNDYETKRSTGYYQTHRTEQMYDLNLIYNKADQYKIHYNTVDRSIDDIENEEPLPDKILNIIGSFENVLEFISIIIATFGVIKRKIIYQKFKKFLMRFFRD